MKTILVVDDEPKITQLVRDYLEGAGYGVRVAHDGKTALSLAKTEKPDLIVLDLGLPQMDGLDFTREYRKVSNAPIIMLTARSEELDKLIGLELGADDYITKPFSPKELVARVRVVFRRIENAVSGNTEMIRVMDLTLDVPRLRATASGREIEELTPTEFELLATLARQPGRCFHVRASFSMQFTAWHLNRMSVPSDADIKNIRHKIEIQPSEPKYIITVYGVGYKFADK